MLLTETLPSWLCTVPSDARGEAAGEVLHSAVQGVQPQEAHGGSERGSWRQGELPCSCLGLKRWMSAWTRVELMPGLSQEGMRMGGDPVRENMFIRQPIKKSSGLGTRGGTVSSGSEHPSSGPNA